MKFVLYVRGQLDHPLSPTAADQQLAYLEDFADAQGASVLGTFSDPIPEVGGHMGAVPELQKAMERCRQSDATLVYLTMGAWRRNPLFFQALRDFKAGGGKVLARSSEKFHAQLEETKKAFRVHVRRAKSGRKGGQGKRLQSAKYVNNKILEQMVVLRDQGLTFGRIAAALNAEGIRTFSGKPWTQDTVRKVFAKHPKKKQAAQ